MGKISAAESGIYVGKYRCFGTNGYLITKDFFFNEKNIYEIISNKIVVFLFTRKKKLLLLLYIASSNF